MKRITPFLIAAVVIAAFLWTLWFLYAKSQAPEERYETAKPEVRDIVEKTVATGAIEPRQQVEIKSRISGVIGELSVEPNDQVKAGQVLATIKIIPDMLSVNGAESSLEAARISFDSSKTELARNQNLFDRGLISQTELGEFELAFKLRRQELRAAKENLELIRSGSVASSNKVSNQVVSAVDGMVIDVPVKEGTSITEANNFNPGTTIAIVADMQDMIFEGFVDESDVGNIKVGMDLVLRIGAIEGKRFPGKLEYIAPKGTLTDGAIQFQIRASLQVDDGSFVRAGYSANADIIIHQETQVLSIPEEVIVFEDKEAFVFVEVGEQKFEKRKVVLGLSDGLFSQVLEGVSPNDRLRRPRGVKATRGRQ